MKKKLLITMEVAMTFILSAYNTQKTNIFSKKDLMRTTHLDCSISISGEAGQPRLTHVNHLLHGLL